MTTAAVFMVYFVGILLVGLIAGRHEQSGPDEYFLAGRRLPWYAVGLSMIGSNISTEHFIGMIGAAYIFGISAANYDMTAFFAMTLLIFIFLPYYFRRRLYTIPEFLEDRYGGSTRVIFAILTVTHMVIVLLAGALYAGGLIFQDLFQPEQAGLTEGGSISPAMLIGIAVIAVTTGVYSIYGGLASVVWTDVAQTILLIMAGTYVTVVALMSAGGWHAVWTANEVESAARVHLLQPATDEFAPWPGVVALFLTLGVWYNCTNQFYIQRCFGARTEWDSRMGIVLAGFIKQLMPLIIVLPGLIGFAIYGAGMNRDKVFMTLIQDHLGPLPVAIVLTGMAAAIMSTVSSVLNSSATIFTIDFYQRFLDPGASHRRLVLVGRWATAVILVIGALWAPMIVYFGEGLFVYIQDMAAFFAPPIAAIFLLGILWRRATTTAANVTLVLGVAAGITLKLTAPSFPSPLAELITPFLNRALVNWVIALALLVGISLLEGKRKQDTCAEQPNLIWRPAFARLPVEERERFHGWRNFYLWWGAVLALRLVTYAIFR